MNGSSEHVNDRSIFITKNCRAASYVTLTLNKRLPVNSFIFPNITHLTSAFDPVFFSLHCVHLRVCPAESHKLLVSSALLDLPVFKEQNGID